MSILVAALIWAAIVIVSMLVASFLAVRWGRDPFPWALLSAILGPIALAGLLGTRQSDSARTDRFERQSARQSETTIVMGSDGSPSSARVARYIARAHPATSEVVLLTVLPQDARAGEDAVKKTEQERAVTSLTQEAKDILTQAGMPVRVVVGYGNAGEELVRFGNEEGASVIAVGRRGAGLTKALLGSVSDYVVRHADRPVAVVD